MYKTSVVLHHSLTKDSQTVSWGAIRKYHVETLGWKDIGYHFGIEQVGDYFEVMAGRPINANGAHCKEQQMNTYGLGVVFVGNCDETEPPVEMLQRMAEFLSPILFTMGIIPTRGSIKMHRDYATYKSCPGVKFPYEAFLDMLIGEL
jgi:hypothetical protein